MNSCLITASFDSRDWFIRTYTVRQIELHLDDLSMVASPVFGGPLVHLFKTGHSVRAGGLWSGFADEHWDTYTINLFSCGPEDSYLVLKHLQDLLKAGKLELPERESYQRYRHDQLEPVEEWFVHPRLVTVSA